MKLNKSLFSLAVLIIILATSCSQARYGSLTRRTKTSHLTEQRAEKQKERRSVETHRNEKGIALEEEKSLQVEKEVPSMESQEPMVFTSRIEKKQEVLARFMTKEESEKVILERAKTGKMATELPLLVSKKVTKKVSKIAEKASADKKHDDLVRILLIVLLVLVILALLPSLGGLIRGLIGLLILILLIWLLLQLL